jgi:hypothetical protein
MKPPYLNNSTMIREYVSDEIHGLRDIVMNHVPICFRLLMVRIHMNKEYEAYNANG